MGYCLFLLLISNEAGLSVVPARKTVSKAENVQLSSRERLLAPIIDRLKAQASHGSPAKLITVTGAVKFPGTYPHAQNQTIAQVVEAAGGLSEKAYLAQAEVSRTLVDGDNIVFIVH